jgi:hypothetical protein
MCHDPTKLHCGDGTKLSWISYDGAGCTGTETNTGWVSMSEWNKAAGGGCAKWTAETHSAYEDSWGLVSGGALAGRRGQQGCF